MSLTQSRLCDGVINYVSCEKVKGNFLTLDSHYKLMLKEIQALSSFLKNHRVNDSNICEVIRVLWGDAVWQARPKDDVLVDYACNIADSQEGLEDTIASLVIYDVTFPDKSQGAVALVKGIGEDFWFIS